MTEIQDAVTTLPARERGRLAAWLLDSLPPHGDENAYADSLREAARRRDELDSDAVNALSAEEFWGSIERERATWK